MGKLKFKVVRNQRSLTYQCLPVAWTDGPHLVMHLFNRPITHRGNIKHPLYRQEMERLVRLMTSEG